MLVVNAEQTEMVLFGERGAAGAMRKGSRVIQPVLNENQRPNGNRSARAARRARA